jgi:23S rRNA G2445 N2-methylase RlmL
MSAQTLIKVAYIEGLRPVVVDEVENAGLTMVGEGEQALYFAYIEEVLRTVKKLRSAARVYVVVQSESYHPAYIANHKSVLGALIDSVIAQDSFHTFKISCAGADSKEVRSIAAYVRDTYHLEERDEADLKIHITKSDEVWELGMQATPRPLSVRDYKAVHMSGAMDPTIAYAVNALSNLEKARAYLNIFSGSGTLLIEAGQCYPTIERIVGFDNDKRHLSSSIQNIKKAGLIEKVRVAEADIFDNPDFGTFDAITSDLPFGMVIGKNEDLEKLYRTFLDYGAEKLNVGGRLVVYTSEHALLESLLHQSRFTIIESLQLKFMTNAGAYLRPKIIVCELIHDAARHA